MLRDRLVDLERRGKPIKVGIIGAGRFGTQVLCQISAMAGMRPSVVADVRQDRGMAAFQLSGHSPADVVVTNRVSEMNVALERGQPVFTEDGLALAASNVDVVVEATGIPQVGARFAMESILQGKHLVMVNVETDVLVGPLLKRMADRAGVVYSLAYGDQPALIHELYDWATALGFQVVAAGKGTKYLPEYRKSTPDTVWGYYGHSPEEALRGRMNPKMYNSFLDGTKSAVEMVAVANMTGLRPDVRGMHFPPAGVADLPNLLKPREHGGILEHSGVVEVVSSLHRDGTPVSQDLRWGVYVVVTSEQPFVRQALPDYGVPVDSTGRYAAFHRPFHLVGMETPVSIARAVLDHAHTGAPIGPPVASVVAVAKRDLKAGETLDGEGGYMVYGMIEDASKAQQERLLPIGLAHYPLVRNVEADHSLSLGDIAPPPDDFTFTLWKLQGTLLPPV